MAHKLEDVEADRFYTRLEDGFHGPFSREDLEAQLIVGSLRSDDLVQIGDEPVWQPVRIVLQRAKPSGKGKTSSGADKVPGWGFVLGTLGRRLQRDLERPSGGTLIVFMLIGAAGMFASRFGWMLWLPWFVFVLIAAVAMLKQRRYLGLPIGLCALAAPFFLLPRHHAPVEAVVDEPFTVAPAPEPAPPPIEKEPIAGLPPAEEPPPATPPPAPVEPAAPVAAVAQANPPTPVIPPPKPTVGDAIPPVPPPAGEVSPEIRKIYQDRSGALVIVRGEGSSGSGFIGNLAGKTYLFTNIHVAAGMKTPVFTLLDGTRLIPVTAEAATKHDIMRFALKEPPRSSIDIVTGLEQKVTIDDEVVVLGNSGGGGVVTSLPGKILGIGPDRIEVNSEFIPGNSGSPIIHVKSGEVLGIATYLTRRHDDYGSTNNGGRVSQNNLIVRRYGYRFDSVTNWEPVNWLAFQAENEQMEKISQLTEDIYNFLEALENKRTPNFATETLRRPATEWRTTLNRKGLSASDRRNATQTFLSDLRFMVRTDVTSAERTLRYGYFRDKLVKEKSARDEMYKSFDTEFSRLSAPSL